MWKPLSSKIDWPYDIWQASVQWLVWTLSHLALTQTTPSFMLSR